MRTRSVFPTLQVVQSRIGAAYAGGFRRRLRLIEEVAQQPDRITHVEKPVVIDVSGVVTPEIVPQKHVSGDSDDIGYGDSPIGISVPSAEKVCAGNMGVDGEPPR